jgi:TolB-like protein/Flp pilus assembly protein TadD
MPDELQQEASNPPSVEAAPSSTPERGLPGHSHTHSPLPNFRFLEHIKRRNVGRVAVLYVVVSYVILEVFGVFVHLLELPAWMGRSIVVLAVLGFPVAVLFAWIYEITPEGLKPSEAVDPRQSIVRQTGRRLDRAIIVVLALILGYFVVDRFWFSASATHRHASVATGAASGAAPAADSAAVRELHAAPEKSVAVLPFVDMSEQHDQEYFSDGLSEELIDMLTKVPDLRVPARTSSFYFKGKQTTIAEIARALNVAQVLEGSVRQSGQQLRVTAQLIRVADGYHIWSETFDRQREDIFKMQDEIAGAVVAALESSLRSRPTSSPASVSSTQSYDFYLRARQNFRHSSTRADYDATFVSLQKSLNADAAFAPAWALRALVRAAYYAEFLGGSARQIRLDAEADARQALALDPGLPDPHLAMAAIYDHIDWKWGAAEREYRRALDLDAGNAAAARGLSDMALYQDRLNEALRLARRAIELDPLNASSYSHLARVLARRGRYADAEQADRKAVDLFPSGHVNRFWVGYDLLALGKPAEALAEFDRIPDREIRRDGLILALPVLGRDSEARTIVAAMATEGAETSAANLAAYYACQGDAERAVAWLNRAYLRKDGYILDTKADFCFKNVMRDPRYGELFRKIASAE